jgi:hypothetical protein
MSNRQDKEREAELQPKRMEFAREKIEALGYDIFFSDATVLAFIHKEQVVKFFPYSGWHSGKSIKDGRGLQNLLNQLTNQ